MNYYAEWWEKARNSTGILTKPIQKKLLEQRIKDLETKWQQEKKNWDQEKQSYETKLTKLETRLNKSKKDKEVQTVIDYEELMEQEKKSQQEQLRKINLLFDDNANNYESIDFNGLYELLKSVAEREREREQNNSDYDTAEE